MSGKSEWRTAISEIRDDVPYLHGYNLLDAANETVPFSAITLLSWTGELPSKEHADVLNALLVLTAAHGISPTGAISRVLAACGVPIQVAVAGATMAMGDYHGGSGEQLGMMMASALDSDEPSQESRAERMIDDCLSRWNYVPGFGHPMHGNGDPRAPFLFRYAAERGVRGPCTELIEATAAALSRRKGRDIGINVVGATVAILGDLGVPWRYQRVLSAVARGPVVGALAVEEMEREKRWRMIASGDDVVYDGVKPRALPSEWCCGDS
jgi:citrate synthase